MSAKTPGQIINTLAPGKFANLGKVTPAGALEARKLTAGTVLYWRVTVGGKTERVVIGNYDASAPPKSLQPTQRGFSVQAAIRAAEVLAQKHQANIKDGGYPALVAAEAEAARLAKVAEADASRAAEKVKIEAARYTLENLLDQYCDYLESLGRRSHKDARSIFKLHVNEAWPKIAALPANLVTGEQVADMMRGLMEAGKGRTSNKLRSYIRAAYQVARAARSKASIPLAFKSFNVTVNPAADTEPDEAQNKADKNPLSADDMRAYWQIIKSMPGFVGAVLRLHLLTGGQRIEQLVNLKTADINGDVITLMDGKGRPGKPARPHSVPLIPLAAAALADCKPKGAYAISTDGGVTHLSAITMSNWAVVAAAGIDGFATKRIRSGVETMLAAAKVPSDHRGRLQSHGINGVQNRHYDGHEYMDEKRGALKKLFALLEARKTGNVVEIRAA